MKIKKTNIITFKLMQKQYGEKINTENILHISKFKIWRILKDESQANKNIFLRNVVSLWIDSFRGSDEHLFSKLKKIIRKTKIKLNDIEQDSLFILEERAFSEIRQIKIIEVNNKLEKGETVGVKFVNSHLYETTNKIIKLYEGILLISNKRIIFEGFDKSFKFINMKSYSNSKDGLEFTMKNGNRFLIRIHDSKTLNNTFNNIINRKVKNAIKKY